VSFTDCFPAKKQENNLQVTKKLKRYKPVTVRWMFSP